MAARGNAINVFDARLFEGPIETLVAREQEVVFATADPEKPQAAIGVLRILEKRLHHLIRFHTEEGTAEGTDIVEQIEIVQAYAQRLAAAHRQADDRPILLVAFRAVAAVYKGDDIANDVLAKESRITTSARSPGRGMTVGHDDNHRFRFAFRDQVVEDDIGSAALHPGAIAVA